MWLIDFLPSWFFVAVLVASIAGLAASYLLKMVPFFSANATPVRIGSIVALLLSVWFLGAEANEDKWLARVKELEAKLAIAEEQSKEANVKLESAVAAKTTIIKERSNTILQYVDAEVSKYDATCKIPAEFITAHNRAAEAVK